MADSQSPSLVGALDRSLAEPVESGAVPGVVALAADREAVLYAGAFGRRGIGQPAAMTLDTVFAIFSMTKAVTAVAALQLVEQRQLTLDEPLAERLPELGAARVLDGFEADGTPRFRAPRRPITLHHLLTHTAGFGYPTWNAELFRLEQQTGASLGLQAPLVFDPGERWEYGINLDWVGLVVEQVSGQSLEDYFRAHILDPLGISDTTFVLTPDQRARLASGHQRQPDGSLAPIVSNIPARPAFYNGGGGLYSTGPDYLRFTRMLLGNGELDGQRVLRAESIAEITRNQIGDLNVEALPTMIPARSNPLEFFPGMIKKWGLGGLINTDASVSARGAGSWAWGGLSNTYFWIDPERGVTGVLLTQILPFCDPPTLAMFEQFEQAVYAASGAASASATGA